MCVYTKQKSRKQFMIKPIINTNYPKVSFGRNTVKYEQDDIHTYIKTQAPDDVEIVSKIIGQNKANSLYKGLLFDKFGAIFEHGSDNHGANKLYKNAVEEKKKNGVSLFELFKSYIALQKTSQVIGDKAQVEEIENYLAKTIAQQGILTPQQLTDEDQNTFDDLFINNALIISKKLFDLNKINSASAIFNEVSNMIKNTGTESKYVSDKYKELKAVLLQKNGEYKASSEIYRELSKNLNKDKNIEYLHSIIQNELSSGNLSVDADLDFCLENSALEKDIIENLFIRANRELLIQNDDNAAKYLNLASIISKNHKSDIKESINLLNATLFRNNGEINKSSEICVENIESLENKNKLYSEEFVKTLILLAANDYDEYKQNSKENKEKLTQAMNGYKNAFEIANIINDNTLKAMITSQMAYIYLEQDDEKHIKTTTDYILNCSKESPFKAEAYKILGLQALKHDKFNEAIKHFEKERQAILAFDAHKSVIQENINNLIESYRKAGDTNKAEEYSKILNDKKSARYKDLLEMGNINIRNGDYKKAQEYFEQAFSLNDEEKSSKAIARIHIGIAKLQTQNDKKALYEIEKGIDELSEIIKEEKYLNKETLKVLNDTLEFTGGYYYFKKADYKKASEYFVKQYKLQNKETALELPSNYKASTITKTGASLYKAGKYEDALPYYIKHLKESTGMQDFKLSSLDAKFIDNILDTKDRKDCLKIATALEIVGVINVKSKRFMTANECFNAALKIREGAGGSKLSLANDYKAIARLAMLSVQDNSKASFDVAEQYLNRSIEIMKSHLGNKAEAVIKEENFLKKHFKPSVFGSLGKYGSMYWGKFKEVLGWQDNYKQEIIDDFHIIYEDLALCE